MIEEWGEEASRPRIPLGTLDDKNRHNNLSFLHCSPHVIQHPASCDWRLAIVRRGFTVAVLPVALIQMIVYIHPKLR